MEEMSEKLKLNATARDWLRKNKACDEGYRWASRECATLSEVWETARPEWLVWVATRPGVLGDRTLWEFSCWCAEQALPQWYAAYPDDHRPRAAIEARRGWLAGIVTDSELSAARSAAESAGSAAAAAWSAAESARSAAAAAWSAARSAAWSARSAAVEKQAGWLRSNASPTFVDGSKITKEEQCNT